MQRYILRRLLLMIPTFLGVAGLVFLLMRVIFPSVDKNPANYSRYIDRTLDELYEKQSSARDPEEHQKYIRQFEKHLLDDEVHYLMTLQWHRIVPHGAKVQGWKVTPSHYLNQQLDAVWLAA